MDLRESEAHSLPTKDYIAIITLLHTLATCIFLFGYARAFGYRLITIFGVEDVFIFSLREMIQAYAIFLGMTAATYFTRKSFEFQKKMKLKSLSTILSIISISFTASVTSLGNQLKYFLILHWEVQATLLLMLIFITISCYIIARADLDDLFSSATLISVGSIFVAFCLVFGLNTGFRDKYRDYEHIGNHLSCRDKEGREIGALIRTVNGYDIVLRINTNELYGSYVIGNELCSHLYSVKRES